MNPACNYYFMAVSTFVLTVVGAVGHRAHRRAAARPVEGGGGSARGGVARSASGAERRGLWAALAAATVFAALLVWGTLPADGFLRDPETGGLLHSPFLSGIVALIFLAGALTGIAYGLGAGTFRGDDDVVRGMSKSMETLGSYLVLVFFAAQFVAYFNWTNLGLIVAVKGADALKASGLGRTAAARRVHRFSAVSTCSWAARRPSGRSWRRCSCRCSCCSATSRS